METMNIQKYISTSPRKLRLVADMVRGMSPERALQTLQFTNKAAADDLAKAIKTALANVVGDTLVEFKSIEVNEGPKLKRYRVGTAGRGRGRPYRRRWSHIKVVLTDQVSVESVKSDKSVKSVRSVKSEKTRKEQKNGSED